MNTVRCNNQFCKKEYNVQFDKCPFCGESNPQFKRGNQSRKRVKANSINSNRLIKLIISCGVAFVVLILCSLIITALGWERSTGAKGIIAGIAIAAGSCCDSYLKGKMIICNKNKKRSSKNNKPKNKNTPSLVSR